MTIGNETLPVTPADASKLLAFKPGDVVSDRYSITRFIAGGGMGDVYEAVDAALHERVALKVIRAGVAPDDTMRLRFRREIQLARRVTHPNVCRVFDLGTHADVTYLTMELLADSETLAARLLRGPMTMKEARPIFEQLVAGLGAAHAAGVVHRDFKSANVMLVRDERVAGGHRAVITDFGLARQHDSEPNTTDGFYGTPAYMAPEQMESNESTPASDIYALGVVMYQTMTGQLPHAGDTPLQTAVRRVTQAVPPPRGFAPDLDPAWEATILRCLARAPGDRFARVQEVIDALDGGGARGPRRRRRWPRVAAAAAAGAVALGGTAFAIWGRREAAAPAAAAARAPRRSVAVVGVKNVTGRPEAAWLATALAEMVGTELGAREELRIVPGESVARVRRELGLGDADAFAADTLAKLRAKLGADYVVVGSYVALPGREVRVDLRVQDTRSGETVALVGEAAPDDQLVELAARAGERMRLALGVGALSAAESGVVRASLPAQPEAARLYAEGLAAQRTYACRAAVDRLSRVVALEPSFTPAHAALAECYWFLGYEDEALQSAERAMALAGNLPQTERLLVEARVWETRGAPEKAAEIYRGLFRAFPDNAELGFRLLRALWHAGDVHAAAAVIDELARMGATAEDPRLDHGRMLLAGARGDARMLRAATARLVERARAQGALPLLMEARATEATMRWTAGDFAGALEAYEEARRSARDLDDRHAASSIGLSAALVQVDAGKLDDAERTLAGVEGGARRGLAARRLRDLALVAVARGDAAAAAERLEAMRALVPVGDEGGYSHAQLAATRGRVRSLRGDLAGGAEDLELALVTFRAREWSSDIAATLAALAEIALERGDVAGARARVGEALAIWERRGPGEVPIETSRCRVLLAEIALADGRAAEAERLARAALAEIEKLADDDTRLRARAALALALASEGRPAEAAAALPAAAKSERMAVRQRVARARGEVVGDTAAVEAARAEAEKSGARVEEMHDRALLVGGGEAGALAEDAERRGMRMVARRARRAAAGK